jgi:hypothetical protein
VEGLRLVDERDVLLNHLRLINEAFDRAGAVPDLTFEEAEDMVSLEAFRTIVAATEERLAKVIVTANWLL